MAADQDLTVAATLAIQEMVNFLADTKGLTKHQAYQLVSITGKCRGHAARRQANVGAHVKMPKNVFR
jgi:acetamidase/formamidase